MNIEAVQEALNDVSIDKIDERLKKRNDIINAAKDNIPKYDYDTNITVRTLHPATQYVVVKEVIDQGSAKTFRLAADNDKGTVRLAPFRAGQYVSVSLDINGSTLTRPYAISSAPDDEFYTITIKKVKDGFVSDYILENWKEGTKAEVSAPEGSFYYEPLRDAGTVVGLAGGSGITPLFSMAQAIRDGREDFKLILLYGCRKEDEILFKDELDSIAEATDKFEVVYVLSDEEKYGYEKGFLTAELIKKHVAGDYSLFVCGPKVMYEFAAKEAEKLGLPKRRVRFEAAGEIRDVENDPDFPKDAVGKTFKLTVDLPEGRRVIDAKSNESILVACERAGIKAESRCRSGECGFCRMRVKSGKYFAPKAAEHRKGADVKYDFIHACSAFPVSDLHILLNYDQGEVVRKVKDMKKKETLVSIIMAIIISAVMGILFAAIARHTQAQNPNAQLPPAAIQFITSALESIVVGIVLVFIIPMGKMGRGLAAKAGAFPPSFKFTLLNSIPFAVINAVIVGAVCSFIGVAQAHAHMPVDARPPLMIMWLGSYLKTLPISIVVSYVLAVIISPMVVQAVGLGGPPTDGNQPRE